MNLARTTICALLAPWWLFLLPASTAPAQQPTALQTAQAMEKTLVEAIARAEKSVVAIARVRKDDRPARAPAGDRPLLGPLRQPFPDQQEQSPLSPDFVPNEYATGVVVDRQGLILTNYHVLGDPNENDYYVWSQGRPFKAVKVERTKAADPWLDLAVLKIPADDLQPIPLGNAKELKKGQIVIALGNPYAIARDGEVSASWGIISNLARQAPPVAGSSRGIGGRETLHHYGTLIHTDVRLNLGTSGGPLLNLDGQMIGLTTSLAALAGYEASAGFAIPVDEDFKRTLDTLIAGRQAEYGFLGVAPGHLAVDLRQQGRRGARINQIVPGTPAATVDLQVGDIVTHVNGELVQDHNGLIRNLSRLPVEARVVLTVERGAGGPQRGRTLHRTVTLSKKYLDTTRPVLDEQELPSWRGMQVDYATAVPPLQFQQITPQVDPAGCVVIVDVQRDSSAWKAGLRPWSFISHVDGTRVATPKEFYAAVDTKTGPVQVQVTSGRAADGLRTVSP